MVLDIISETNEKWDVFNYIVTIRLITVKGVNIGSYRLKNLDEKIYGKLFIQQSQFCDSKPEGWKNQEWILAFYLYSKKYTSKG